MAVTECLESTRNFSETILSEMFSKAAASSINLTQIKSSYASYSLPQLQLHPRDAPFQSSQEVIGYASCFTFKILTIVLKEIGDENTLPHVHVSLAFIWVLAMVPDAMSHIQHEIPWAALVRFLNALNTQDLHAPHLRSTAFPASDSPRHHLPEDFPMRGLIWSQFYYPAGFFEVSSLADEEKRYLERPSVTRLRTESCLWLGHNLASLDVWFTFDDRTGRFVVRDFAGELEKHAKGPGLFVEAERYFQDQNSQQV
ncbi:hypothetical protein LOZ65_006862 [Ophidiomyces ophidiicola]|nr:hypothetical protein LOZ65_006862 [Ophidiomyces ophidiicola]